MDDVNKGRQEAETEQGERSKTNIEMPAEKAYDLLKIKVLTDLEKEFFQWLKWRFAPFIAIGGLVVGVVGLFGLGIYIKDAVRTLGEKEIADANKAATIAQNSAERATIATEEITKQAQTYAKTVTTLQEKANQVDAQFIGVRERLQAESANVKAGAAREAKEIATRLARLETLVAGLAKQPQKTEQAVAAYQKESNKQREAASSEAKRFAENSGYYVTVYYNEKTRPLSTKIVENLAQVGFKAASTSIETLSSIPTSFSFGRSPTDPSKVAPERQVDVTTNRIVFYNTRLEMKAKEIGDLLRSLVQFSAIRLWAKEDPIEIIPMKALTWESIREPIRQRISILVVHL